MTPEGPIGRGVCIATSPDGKWIAGGDENTNIVIWNAKTGQRVKLIENNNDWVSSLSFGSDSKTLVSSSDDSTVRTFSVPGGQEKLKLRRHNMNVKSATFSEDGKLIASSGVDNTIRIWDAITGNGGEPSKSLVIPTCTMGNVLFLPGAKVALSTDSGKKRS